MADSARLSLPAWLLLVELNIRCEELEASEFSSPTLLPATTQVEFILTVDPQLYSDTNLLGDADALRQCLVHLCENGVKFSPGEKISCSPCSLRCCFKSFQHRRLTCKQTGLSLALPIEWHAMMLWLSGTAVSTACQVNSG